MDAQPTNPTSLRQSCLLLPIKKLTFLKNLEKFLRGRNCCFIAPSFKARQIGKQIFEQVFPFFMHSKRIRSLSHSYDRKQHCTCLRLKPQKFDFIFLAFNAISSFYPHPFMFIFSLFLSNLHINTLIIVKLFNKGVYGLDKKLSCFVKQSFR